MATLRTQDGFGAGATLLAISLAALILAGCSKVPEGHRHVTGEIQLPDGSPLSGLLGAAVVRFDPADPEVRELRESIGFIEEDGTFEVMTYEGGDGVPLGDYKVVLTMEKYPDNYKIVPDHYTHYETTPWEAEVTKGGDNHFILKISHDAPKPEAKQDG